MILNARMNLKSEHYLSFILNILCFQLSLIPFETVAISLVLLSLSFGFGLFIHILFIRFYVDLG